MATPSKKPREHAGCEGYLRIAVVLSGASFQLELHNDFGMSTSVSYTAYDGCTLGIVNSFTLALFKRPLHSFSGSRPPVLNVASQLSAERWPASLRQALAMLELAQ